jgi:hypothetical protein
MLPSVDEEVFRMMHPNIRYQLGRDRVAEIARAAEDRARGDVGRASRRWLPRIDERRLWPRRIKNPNPARGGLPVGRGETT